MIIICFCLSLIVSGVLVVLMIKFQSRDPFPPGSIRWMLLWGAWIAVLTGVFLLALDGIFAAIHTGDFSTFAIFKEKDPLAAKEELEEITGPERITFFYLFREAFLSAAIPEEIAKFIIAADFLFWKKLARKRPCFHGAICCALVALGFEIIEDIMYISGDLITAILRGLMPLHFCVDVIMGFFIGKAIASGRKIMYLPALLIPILIHGIYDALIFALDLSDWILIPFFILYFFLISLTIAELIVLGDKSREVSTW